MTLRTDYFDGASGIQQALANANDAGVAYVTASLATLSSGLTTAASQGKTQFVVTIATSYQPTALRTRALILDAYLAGIVQGLATQKIYAFECVPTLNTTDQTTTYIDFTFNFSTL